jgi:hypothetical protein
VLSQHRLLLQGLGCRSKIGGKGNGWSPEEPWLGKQMAWGGRSLLKGFETPVRRHNSGSAVRSGTKSVGKEAL